MIMILLHQGIFYCSLTHTSNKNDIYFISVTTCFLNFKNKKKYKVIVDNSLNKNQTHLCQQKFTKMSNNQLRLKQQTKTYQNRIGFQLN